MPICELKILAHFARVVSVGPLADGSFQVTSSIAPGWIPPLSRVMRRVSFRLPTGDNIKPLMLIVNRKIPFSGYTCPEETAAGCGAVPAAVLDHTFHASSAAATQRSTASPVLPLWTHHSRRMSRLSAGIVRILSRFCAGFHMLQRFREWRPSADLHEGPHRKRKTRTAPAHMATAA